MYRRLARRHTLLQQGVWMSSRTPGWRFRPRYQWPGLSRLLRASTRIGMASNATFRRHEYSRWRRSGGITTGRDWCSPGVWFVLPGSGALRRQPPTVRRVPRRSQVRGASSAGQRLQSGSSLLWWCPGKWAMPFGEISNWRVEVRDGLLAVPPHWRRSVRDHVVLSPGTPYPSECETSARNWSIWSERWAWASWRHS